MKKLFDDKPWFKGNLHTHTRVSDGRKTIEESAAMYKAKGYDFIAVTDHRKVFHGGEQDGLLLLSGVELHENYTDDRRICYHITGLGLKDDIQSDDSDTPQQLIDKLRAAGSRFITIAHPGFSLMRHEDITALHGLDAMEVYNGVSDVYSGHGYYEDYVDILASKGWLPKITAVDDTHFYLKDFARGFVRVQADACTEEDIVNALAAGRFYSSEGPELKQITVEDDRITVDTSEVKEIRFYSDLFYCRDRIRYPKPGEKQTHAVYFYVANENWVRIEAIDHDGNKCWSNIIPIPGRKYDK